MDVCYAITWIVTGKHGIEDCKLCQNAVYGLFCAEINHGGASKSETVTNIFSSTMIFTFVFFVYFVIIYKTVTYSILGWFLVKTQSFHRF